MTHDLFTWADALPEGWHAAPDGERWWSDGRGERWRITRATDGSTVAVRPDGRTAYVADGTLCLCDEGFATLACPLPVVCELLRMDEAGERPAAHAAPAKPRTARITFIAGSWSLYIGQPGSPVRHLSTAFPWVDVVEGETEAAIRAKLAGAEHHADALVKELRLAGMVGGSWPAPSEVLRQVAGGTVAVTLDSPAADGEWRTHGGAVSRGAREGS